ncbi:MAG: hypothetical protein K9J04_04135 [Burkholderiales bacterium]|nr:hypothetical protein [Burkholderiales bacterium]
MFKLFSKAKQRGIQVLEYGLLGAIVVGGGAYAVATLSNQSKDKQAEVGNCIDVVGKTDTNGAVNANECQTVIK